MELPIRIVIKYKDKDDKEIVLLITNEKKHDEEAATYLLWGRYDPLLKSVYQYFFDKRYWYDYAVETLFMYLRGDDGQWVRLSSFEWRSTLGYWLKRVSYRLFLDLWEKLIDNGEIVVSRDDDDPESAPIQIADPDIDVNLRKAELMEAVSQLEDIDQRFVVIKRLQGYSSKEIAILMRKMWKRRGIVRYDNQGKVIIPTYGFVDVRMQRAKEELKKIIGSID